MSRIYGNSKLQIISYNLKVALNRCLQESICGENADKICRNLDIDRRTKIVVEVNIERLVNDK